LRAFRKGLEFRLWQVPETQLYGPQFVKDHVDRSRESPPWCANGRRIFQELLSRILGGMLSVVNSHIRQRRRFGMMLALALQSAAIVMSL
jgi:hypothetical protein